LAELSFSSSTSRGGCHHASDDDELRDIAVPFVDDNHNNESGDGDRTTKISNNNHDWKQKQKPILSCHESELIATATTDTATEVTPEKKQQSKIMEGFSLIPSRNARFANRVQNMKFPPTRIAIAAASSRQNEETESYKTRFVRQTNVMTTASCNRGTCETKEEAPKNEKSSDDNDDRKSAATARKRTSIVETISLIPSKNDHSVKKIQRHTDMPKKDTATTNSHNGTDHTTPDDIHDDLSDSSTGPVLSDDSSQSHVLMEAQNQQEVIQLPANILLENISPFIHCRTTWNAIATLNKEVHLLSKTLNRQLYRPWPKVRRRVASGRPWTVTSGKDYFCCGTDKGNLLVWKVYENGEAKVLPGHCGRVNSVKCHGDWIVSAGDDKSTKIWNVETLLCEAVLDGHRGTITSVALFRLQTELSTAESTTPVSNTCCDLLVATACRFSEIRIYTVHCEGNKVLSTKHMTSITNAHEGPVQSIEMMYKENGHYCMISGGENCLLVWDIDARSFCVCGGAKRILRYDGDVRSIAVSLHGKIAAASGHSVFWKGVENNLYDIESSGDSRNGWKVLKGHSSNIRCIDFSPDGKCIATACSDGSIRLWELKRGTWVRKWIAHDGFMVCSLAYSSDGTSLLSAGSDGTIAIETI
jgi:WD40 repeat protein